MKFSLKYISWQSIFLLVIYFVLYIELDYVLGLILLHYKILLYVTRLQIRFLKLLRYLKPLCCFSINILKTFLKGIAIFSSLQSYLSGNCTKKFFFFNSIRKTIILVFETIKLCDFCRAFFHKMWFLQNNSAEIILIDDRC